VYCCQRDGASCCEDPSLQLILGPGKPIKYEARPTSVPSDELAAATSGISNSTLSNHTINAPPSPSTSTSSSSRSQGENAGQQEGGNPNNNVAGVLVGFATAVMFFVGAWTIWICRRHRQATRRRRAEAAQQDELERAQAREAPKELDAVDAAVAPPAELDGRGRGVELEAGAGAAVVASPVSWTTERSAGTVVTMGTLDSIGTLVTEEIVEMEAPSGRPRRGSCEKIGLG
jgi:hypothetical protein